MACPTCDHTMKNVGLSARYEQAPKMFWCPRCGTLKVGAGDATGQNTDVPSFAARFATKLRTTFAVASGPPAPPQEE